jgi:hypothetical protein
MSSTVVTGSCLCGGVKFEIELPFLGFRYCHCSRCRKASGSAHAANAFVMGNQFRWAAGESLIKRFDLPGAKSFAVWFCTQCGTRLPHKQKTADRILVPAGLLDGDPKIRPEYHQYWQSKAPWYDLPHELPRFDEHG